MNTNFTYYHIKEQFGQLFSLDYSLGPLRFKEVDPLPYAYPCDSYMESILSNKVVRKTLQHFVDQYYKEQSLSIMSSGQLVTQEKYPRFYTIFQECRKALDVTENLDIYITDRLHGINALTIGTDNQPAIFFSRQSIIMLPNSELKFMIGHELGHVLQKNLICHTIKGMLDTLNNKSAILGSIVSDLIDIPLNHWYKCAEYTADRAGYICCKDINSIVSLFDNLRINSSKTGYYYMQELYSSHPHINNRINKIKEYAFRH